MEAHERSATADQLEQELRKWDKNAKRFFIQSDVAELLQISTTPYSHQSAHMKCCLPVPFSPLILEFPPAGIFRIVAVLGHTYLRMVMYPPIREARGVSTSIAFDEEDMSYYSLEVCRTFAGLEPFIGDNFEPVLSLFAPLIITMVTCPAYLRPWLWCKLLHFKDLAQLGFDPLHRNMERLCNMQDKVAEDFLNSTGRPLPAQLQELSLNDNEESEDIRSSIDDESLRPLTEGRGLYGLSKCS